MPITLGKDPIDELLELKAALRAQHKADPIAERISEPYEYGNDLVRYIIRRKTNGRVLIYKGTWYVNWRPIGENALFHRLRHRAL